MLSVKFEKKAGRDVYRLQGTIEENFEPEVLFKDLSAQAPLEFNLLEVIRINSVGVKKWIAFFGPVTKKFPQTRFTELSPAMVEQANLISNFLPSECIESVMLPFRCPTCKEEVFFTKTQSAILGVDLDRVTWPCPKCGGVKLQFDDIADEYLSFWKR